MVFKLHHIYIFQVHGADDKVPVSGDTCSDDTEYSLHIQPLPYLPTPVLLTLPLKHSTPLSATLIAWSVTHSASLTHSSQHHYVGDLVLPHHSPEVINSRYFGSYRIVNIFIRHADNSLYIYLEMQYRHLDVCNPAH